MHECGFEGVGRIFILKGYSLAKAVGAEIRLLLWSRLSVFATLMCFEIQNQCLVYSLQEIQRADLRCMSSSFH